MSLGRLWEEVLLLNFPVYLLDGRGTQGYGKFHRTQWQNFQGLTGVIIVAEYQAQRVINP